MVEELVNVPDELQPPEAAINATPPTVIDIEGIGEVVAGHGNATTTLVVGMCALNNPQVNQYFLASNLHLSDRLTGTQIFPRDGMSMPDGGSYVEKTEDN